MKRPIPETVGRMRTSGCIPLERPPSSAGRSVLTSRETSSVDCVGRGCWGTFEPFAAGDWLEVATRLSRVSREMPRSISPRILCLASLRTSAGASLMAPVVPEAEAGADGVRGEADVLTTGSKDGFRSSRQ